MNCDEFIKVWAGKLEPFAKVSPDKLHAESNEEAEACHHLQECRRCARKIDTFDFALNLIRDEIHKEPAAAFWHNLRAEIKKQLKPAPLRQRFFSRPIFSRPIFSRQWQPVWALVPVALVTLLLLTFFPLNLVTPSRPDNIFLMSGGIPGFEYEIDSENNLTNEDDANSEIIYAAIDNWADLLAETIEINSNS